MFGLPRPGPSRSRHRQAYCLWQDLKELAARSRPLPCRRSKKGTPVFSTDLSTRSCDGHALVALRGELDVADAVAVAAALGAVAAREPGIIVDLAGLASCRHVVKSACSAERAEHREHGCH